MSKYIPLLYFPVRVNAFVLSTNNNDDRQLNRNFNSTEMHLHMEFLIVEEYAFNGGLCPCNCSNAVIITPLNFIAYIIKKGIQRKTPLHAWM